MWRLSWFAMHPRMHWKPEAAGCHVLALTRNETSRSQRTLVNGFHNVGCDNHAVMKCGRGAFKTIGCKMFAGTRLRNYLIKKTITTMNVNWVLCYWNISLGIFVWNHHMFFVFWTFTFFSSFTKQWSNLDV